MTQKRQINTRKDAMPSLVVGIVLIMLLAGLYATTDLARIFASLGDDWVSSQLFLIFLPAIILALLPSWAVLQYLRMREAPLFARIIVFITIYIVIAWISCVIVFSGVQYKF